MIKVYFESKNNAEIVALFEDDFLYNLCADSLEKEAKKRGCILTESDAFPTLNELINK